jgi:MYXO-CTERM domain-containing protein
MKSIIASSLALGLLVGSAMAQTVSFSGSLSPVATLPNTVNASGTFSGTYNYTSGALTISGSTFYTTYTGTSMIPVGLTGGAVTPGPASLSVAGSSTSSFQIPLILTGGNTVFSNLRVQTFSGTGSAAFNVQQTITLNDGNGAVLTGTFTPVPEPETYAAVAALGLVGFGLWRRRNA